MFDKKLLTIPKENTGYTTSQTQIYEQTQALETVVNYIKDQTDNQKWYDKYKTVNPQQLAYYICKNGDMILTAERYIGNDVNGKPVSEFVQVKFDDNFLEDFWTYVKDQDPLIQ